MRRITLLLLLSILILATSCASSYLEGVAFVNAGDRAVEVIDGESFQVAEVSPGVMMALHAEADDGGDEVLVTVGISNNSDVDVGFSDASFTLERGNSESGVWKSLGAWDSSHYYRAAYDEARADLATASLAGAFAVADAYTTTRVTISSDGSLEGYTRITPARAILTAALANSYLYGLEAESRATLDSLSASLLSPTVIGGGQEYAGLIYIPSDNRSPEYRVTYTGADGEATSFIFSRSDRDAVLNHWKDQTRSRGSIVMSLGLLSNRVSSTWYLSRKSGLGLYLGISLSDFASEGEYDDAGSLCVDSRDWDNFALSFDPDVNDSLLTYDAHYEVESILRLASVGFPFGVNWRILPNTWLVAGLEFGFYVGQISRGRISYIDETGAVQQLDGTYTIYSDAKEAVYISPQLGLNFITNFLDFSMMLTYRIPDRAHFELGFGFAY